MPIGGTTPEHTKKYWAEHWDYLKSLIEENPKVEARRSRSLRGDIVREIIKDLIVSPIVLADLTDSNPNVYWELGVRQSFKPCSITIADDACRDKIPFNIGSKGVLFYYPDDIHRDNNFRADLKTAVQDCLRHPDRPDSSVLETVSGRGTLYETVHREESIRRLDALIQEIERNQSVYKDVVDIAKKNRQLRKRGKSANLAYPARRFRPISAELLVAHRYLDETATFYRWASTYYQMLSQINDQLNLWESRAASTESWLLDKRACKSRQTNLQGFRSRVKAARDRLVKQAPS
jgi:hypothetical protein